MTNYKLKHDRPNCIGCAACSAIAPGYWDMDNEGKSYIIKGKRLEDGTEEKLLTIDKEINKEAAESCPVNVIHLIDEETGEEII